MKQRHNSYIVAYDIASSKRLKQCHRFLSKRGLWLQNSVFLIEASRRELKSIEKKLRLMVDVKQDDARIYPISHPAHMWLSGKIAVQDDLYGHQVVDANSNIRKHWSRFASSLRTWLTVES